MRIFIALELPPPVQTALQIQLDRLQAITPPQTVRWVQPSSIHLTLKFLGDVMPAQLDQVKAGTERASQTLTPIALQAYGLGCFPNPKRPNVVWVGLKGEIEKLNLLQSRLEAEIAPLGFPTEKRSFSPHLTLGRVKTTNHTAIEAIGQTILKAQVGVVADWTAHSISIIQSTLKPAGAVYNTLAEVKFNS